MTNLAYNMGRIEGILSIPKIFFELIDELIRSKNNNRIVFDTILKRITEKYRFFTWCEKTNTRIIIDHIEYRIDLLCSCGGEYNRTQEMNIVNTFLKNIEILNDIIMIIHQEFWVNGHYLRRSIKLLAYESMDIFCDFYENFLEMYPQFKDKSEKKIA